MIALLLWACVGAPEVRHPVERDGCEAGIEALCADLGAKLWDEDRAAAVAAYRRACALGHAVSCEVVEAAEASR